MFKAIVSATKAMLSVVALVLAFTVNATAQDRSAEAAQRMTDNMKTELSLTDAQYTKVLGINKDFAAKTAEARKASTDRAAVAKSVQGLNDEREKQLKTVLTDEQYKNYLVKKDEKKKMARQKFQAREAQMEQPARTAAPKQ